MNHDQPTQGGSDTVEATIGGMPWRWDLDRGVLLHLETPAVAFWLSPSLEHMLRPLRDEVGDDLFRLLVAYSGTRGADFDYQQIVSRYGRSFKEGLHAWASMVASGGWGRIALAAYDEIAHTATVRIDNPWELRLTGTGDSWGCPFLQGKVVGIFTSAFGVTCWAEESVNTSGEHPYVEFLVAPSSKTIPDEITALRKQRMHDGERQLAEQVRLKSEELYRAQEEQRGVLASLSDLVVVTDRDAVIRQYYEPTDTECAFPAREGAMAAPVTEVFGAELREALTAAKDGGITAKVELAVDVKGQKRHYDCRVSLLRELNEPVGGWTLVLRDNTQKRALEHGLQHRTRMEAIGHLSDGIAHDFNNLLVGIAGSAELIQVHEEPTTKALAATILEASASATGLIDRMLDFSRKRELAYRSVDMHALIRETMSLLRRTRASGIEYHADLQASRVLVEGDVSQLQGALMNLLINARDALPKGGQVMFRTYNLTTDAGEHPTYSIGSLVPGDYIGCSVRDSGDGIAPETLARIFEPFFTTKAGGRGTGLGLTSVASAAMDHRAAVAVHSQLGGGSEFTLYLPLQSDQASAAPTGHEEGNESKGTVLFAEDDELVRGVGIRILNLMGYQVLVAANGQEALDLYRESGDQVDVVLLDLVMPVLGGADTLKRMREIGCSKPVLIASGGVAPESVVDAADGVLQKPYSMVSLSRALSEALQANGGR